MAHFAQLAPSGVVMQVIVVSNETLGDLPFPESEPVGVKFCQSLFGAETEWKQTSYNTNFRQRYAGIGFSYDAVRDAFIPEQPYPSWVLNEGTLEWEAPVPYPADGGAYYWDEATVSWAAMSSSVETA